MPRLAPAALLLAFSLAGAQGVPPSQVQLNGMLGTRAALLIIDGVRVSSDPRSTSIGVGGQEPSRINDLKPEDIESIEILKGPAATGLYGTQAANGVIQVTTKRGTRSITSITRKHELHSSTALPRRRSTDSRIDSLFAPMKRRCSAGARCHKPGLAGYAHADHRRRGGHCAFAHRNRRHGHAPPHPASTATYCWPSML